MGHFMHCSLEGLEIMKRESYLRNSWITQVLRQGVLHIDNIQSSLQLTKIKTTFVLYEWEMWSFIFLEEEHKMHVLTKEVLTYLLTYCMVQDIIWKADSHIVKQQPAFFMGPEGSLPCSQKPVTWTSRIQFAPSISISLKSILMLSSHLRLGLSGGLKSHVLFWLFRSCQKICPGPRGFETFRNTLFFLRCGVVGPMPIPKLVGHPLSDVRDCLFNIFAATLHIWGRSSPSAVWGRAMLWWQGTHLTWNCYLYVWKCLFAVGWLWHLCDI